MLAKESSSSTSEPLSVSRKGLLTIVDQAIVSGTRFLTTIIIGKFCSLESLTAFSIGLSFVVLGNCLIDGLLIKPYTVISASMTSEERKRYQSSCFLQMIFWASLCMVVTVAIGFLLSFKDSLAPFSKTCIAAGIAIPFSISVEFSRRLAYASLNVIFAIVIDLLMCIGQLSTIAILLRVDLLADWSAFVAVGTGCLLGTFVGLFNRIIHFQKSTLALHKTYFIKNVLFGRWLLLGQIVGVIHPYIVLWTLASLLTPSKTGTYVAAETIVLICNPLMLAIGTLAVPLFASALAKSGVAGINKVFFMTSIVAVTESVILMAIFGLTGELLLTLLFEENFSGQGILIWILASGFICSSLSILIESALAALSKPKATFVARLIGALTTAILVLPLVSYWGTVGGATSLIIGSFVATGGQFIVLRSFLKKE